jgi:hypothetical protein
LYRFRAAKELGDKALAQLSDDDLRWRPDTESNSIAVVIQHLHGNMMSRWTDFLTTDGEKPTRNRDAEFIEPERVERADLMQKWDEGWACLLSAIESLRPGDLLREVRIRGQELTAVDAILRQLSHVPYHIGQIVYLARMRRGADWKTLSIPRGGSGAYRPERRD